MTPSHDVVLVGGGGAGLRAAIAIAETNPRINVAVVSKVYPMRSHTVSAEGGAAGAIAADDSLDEEQERRAGRVWVDIGSGAWDRQGRPSEVRVNRVLRIDPDRIRREGAVLARDRFDAVAGEESLGLAAPDVHRPELAEEVACRRVDDRLVGEDDTPAVR